MLGFETISETAISTLVTVQTIQTEFWGEMRMA